MNTSRELHVIFGTGPVGTTLADELLARGKQVRLVNRSGRGQIPPGAELVAGDASKLAVVERLSKASTGSLSCHPCSLRAVARDPAPYPGEYDWGSCDRRRKTDRD